MSPSINPPSEHLIRLRGGWERHGLDAETAAVRVTLPLDGWPDDWGPTRLVRHFQQPSIEVGTESLRLRLGAVPGLIAVTIDGLIIDQTEPHDLDSLLSFDLDRPRRHTLELTVDPAQFDPAADSQVWGEVALVIRSEAETLGGRGGGI